MIQCWRLDDAAQTLVLAAYNQQLAEVIYWGAPLPVDEELTQLYHAQQSDVTGGMLDRNPPLSICPEAKHTFAGQTGFVCRNQHGEILDTHFTLTTADSSPQALCLHYQDDNSRITYKAVFALHSNTHVLQCHSEIHAEHAIYCQWLAAPVFPAPQHANNFIEFSGRWCGEFQTARQPWSTGCRLRNNRTGRTGHEHFPAVLLPSLNASNTAGDVYSFHYGWSGGHRMVVEELPDGRRQIQFGHAENSEQKPAKHFATAPLYAVYSNKGINGCAVAYQRHVRQHIVKFSENNNHRPVHYNCWEAVYFDHQLDALKVIAEQAAELGAERFVLDDGWFGQRNDDTSSLGDWFIDTRKYPAGLTPLIEHVHQQNMTFGLWFEPEMINPNSALHQQHPEWCLGDASQILGRQQKVLNLALDAVREYLFNAISNLLTDYAIDYIKWDHNRVLPIADAAQARGCYALIDKIRRAFPHVEIESCASGGGRIDFGILTHTQRVWLSDSNDAVERLKIQHNAALFLPACVTGSHVGPRVCHTSGRTLNIRFRAWVAAQRHMGFEMDPRELDEEERAVLKTVTAWWKRQRHWLMHADILRLDTIDDSIIAEQQLAADGSQFVLFVGKQQTSQQILPRPVSLTALDPNASYEIELINRDDAAKLSRAELLIKQRSLTLSGRYLMSQGIQLPWQLPETMWVVQGKKL